MSDSAKKAWKKRKSRLSAPRLSALMTVYNEADFVEYAIRAALPYVDDLVVVEVL